MTTAQSPDLAHLMAKIEQAKKSGNLDLSTEEDLSIAIMNLISLEEHFFFTNAKTGKPEYLDLLKQVREMRKELLARMIPRNEGETWCISKHLLAAAMRLIEVGTKLNADNKQQLAQETLAYAYELYALFWGLRLKLISLPEVKRAAADEKPWTLKDIADKLVDCCKE